VALIVAVTIMLIDPTGTVFNRQILIAESVKSQSTPLVALVGDVMLRPEGDSAENTAPVTGLVPLLDTVTV
jgi:hypothetical protein